MIFFWIFVWGGRGPLGLLALVLPLASCVGLVDWNPLAAIAAFGLTLGAVGVACRHYGRKWNRGSGVHMMYWVPLEYWGWAYIVAGALVGLLGVAALVKDAVVG